MDHPYALEIDPQRMDDVGQTADNVEKIISISQSFVDHVCDSVTECPLGVRRLLKYVSDTAAARFPNMRLLSIGNLLFLRFLNPSIVTPNPGLPELDRHTRRSAMLVVKLLNNLINEVSFDGLKEAYMLPLNPFISAANLQQIHKFITNLITLDDTTGDSDSKLARGFVAAEVREQAPSHLTNFRSSLETIKKSALAHLSQLSAVNTAVQSLSNAPKT